MITLYEILRYVDFDVEELLIEYQDEIYRKVEGLYDMVVVTIQAYGDKIYLLLDDKE